MKETKSSEYFGPQDATTEAAELVDTEIVEADMSEAEALAITDRIRAALDDVWGLIKQAYARRAWAALGYDTWNELLRRRAGHLTAAATA